MPKPKRTPKIDVTSNSGFKNIGFFTVNDEECVFRHNIEQTYYRLKQSHENFNALYALLLGAYLSRDRVDVTYSSMRSVGTDETFKIVVSATVTP